MHLSGNVDERWEALTLASSDFSCRGGTPEEEQQADEMEQIVLKAEFACFVSDWDKSVMHK